MRAIDPLHRQSERRLLQALFVDGNGLEIAHQRGAAMPGHVCALGDDVVALQRGHRNEGHVVESDARREIAVLRGDGTEWRLRILDEIHLVDRHQNLPDAEQRHQVAVPARLRERALAGIDDQHGYVGRRSPGDHVAGVLLVAGRVGDDVLPPVGGEVAVRNVDGDPLLALGGEAVEQQREIEPVALRAHLPRIRLERRELILEQQLRFVEQPADQRALAVVDAAAGDEPQQAFPLVRGQIMVDFGCDRRKGSCHQK